MSLPVMDSLMLGSLIAFAIAIFALDVYDVSLPRSGSIGVAGAVVAASMSVLGPLVAFALGVSSMLIVQLARLLRGGEKRDLAELRVRLTATLAAVGAFSLLVGEGTILDYARIIVVPAAFSLTELAVRQLALSMASGKSLSDMVSDNMSRQSLLFAAEVSVAALTVILHREIWIWSIVTVLVLLLLIRQSYAMLLEVRETYQTSVSMLVEVAEAEDPALEGHSERVAQIARNVAVKCNMNSGDLERIGYAALLHDVYNIAGSTSDELERKSTSAEVVGDVGFLSGVVPLLDIVDGRLPAGVTERQLLSGFIVALASDIDRALEPRVSTVHPHDRSTDRLMGLMPASVKARAVSAAVASGYPVPAVE